MESSDLRAVCFSLLREDVWREIFLRSYMSENVFILPLHFIISLGAEFC